MAVEAKHLNALSKRRTWYGKPIYPIGFFDGDVRLGTDDVSAFSPKRAERKALRRYKDGKEQPIPDIHQRTGV